LFCQGK